MHENQIFKATYSGVPVYEMMCKGVAVMRRKSDGWMNATQILKVAGFDKPQRTRVLERDIQKGEHEKVQGGYGKYQGTWIPLERGLELAKLYNCEVLLRAIIDFHPDNKSPPPAPKHVTSAASAPAQARKEASVNTRPPRNVPKPEVEVVEEEALVSDDGSESPSPSEVSTASPTPPPLPEDGESPVPGLVREMKHFYGITRPGPNKYDDESGSDDESLHMPNYIDEILEYFISESSQIPKFLINPPKDYDPNIAIDDDGHTALHWAAAMGRIRVVKLLLTAGADIFKVNNAGQTALMRSVMFSNNYDVRKFLELYELLHRSTLNIDNYNRTVFHHIMEVAMAKGKIHAARYYLETILQRLSEYPKELADIINFQDEDGETALTMAARSRSKRLVKLLIDHGADPKITNRDSKSTEDYILEDVRYRSSPTLSSRAVDGPLRSLSSTHVQSNVSAGFANGHIINGGLPLHHSLAAQVASTQCINEMSLLLENLASSFDQELREKERDLTQAQLILHTIQSEILEHQRSIAQLKQHCQGYDEAKTNLTRLKAMLSAKMGHRYRLGWEKWIRDEEERERLVRSSEMGKGLPIIPETGSECIPDSATVMQLVGILTGTSDHLAKGVSQFEIGEGEDISDLQELYGELPADEAGIQEACQKLRAELEQGRVRRGSVFDELVTLQAEAGTSGRMAQYRRLLGAGCGGMPIGDVDDALSMLLETLEAEEPSSESLSWNNSKASRVGGL